MRKRKITLVTLAFILVFTALSGVVYAVVDVKKDRSPIFENDNPVKATKKFDPLPAISNEYSNENVTIDFKKTEEKIDTSNIELSSDIINRIKKVDSKNFNKNLDNYKKILVKFTVPESYKTSIEKMIKKGNKVPDILAVYDFLYYNYGTIYEMETLINKLEYGETFVNIIRGYNETYPEYVPTKFDETYIQNLMKILTIDDILIADRISQKGLAKFEDLIRKKQSGDSWYEINTSLGLLNNSDKLPRMSLTSSQVKKCMKDNNLSEKDATDLLVLAWKLGNDYAFIKNGINSGKKKIDIIVDMYYEKYK